MRGIERRLAKLETEGSRDIAARGSSPEEAAHAHAALDEFLSAVAAEKAAEGDVHGVADRQLGELIAVLERKT